MKLFKNIQTVLGNENGGPNVEQVMGIAVALAVGAGLFLFGLMYFIMRLGNFIFKKESLGGGDVKLMFFVCFVILIVKKYTHNKQKRT